MGWDGWNVENTKFGVEILSSMLFLELRCPGGVIDKESKHPASAVVVPGVAHSVYFQVYQIQLDSRFEPPADHGSISGGGGRGRYSTLEIRWSVASDATSLGQCEWRVSRLREGDPEFAVKEGVGAEQWLAASQANSDGAEPRDGHRYRTVCKDTKYTRAVKVAWIG